MYQCVKFSLNCLIVLLLFSCQPAFTNKDQAKNEVNKKGFRDGRWVDFFDESENYVQDSTSYAFYVLSEYDEGRPINEFRVFNKKNILLMQGQFLADSITYDSKSLPKRYTGLLKKYADGFLFEIQKYDEKGMLTNETNYVKNNKKKAVDSLSFNYTYYPNSEDLKTIKYVGIDQETGLVTLKPDSWANNDSQKIRDAFYKIIIDKLSSVYDLTNPYNNKIMDIIFNRTYFFRLDQVKAYDNKGKLTNSLDFSGTIKNYYVGFSKAKKDELVQSNRNSVSCYNCGRYFDRRTGFVYNPFYQSFKEAIPASQVGLNDIVSDIIAAESKSVARAYDKQEMNFCSRRCVYESGYTILE